MNTEAPRFAVRRWPPAEREHLENEWREKVELDKALYERWRREYSLHRELAADVRDAGSDGTLLHVRCRELYDAQQAALDQYRADLQKFNRLILYGERPPE